MAVDHFRYDILAQKALRGMVRNVLIDAAKKGLPGDHHFFISFDTRADGVRLSTRMREQYPEEMTIVLQHQFWDLKVGEDAFEVGLSFNGVAERLLVPYAAIKSFVDPSVQFALQFEAIAESAGEAAVPAKTNAEKPSEKTSGKQRRSPRHEPGASVPSISPVAAAAAAAAAPADPTPASKTAPSDDKPDKPTPGGQVVRLDRYRKK
jgi:hypothetical protein